MRRVIAGIDVGLKGGVAFLEPANPQRAFAVIMPTCEGPRGDIVDFDALARLLAANMPTEILVESVWGIAGQGAKSMFRFGEAFGTVVSCVKAGRYRLSFVNPTTWQGKIIPGTEKGDTKPAAAAFVRRHYPHVQLVRERCRVPHDGMADALCIAHYAAFPNTGGSHASGG